MSIFHSPQWKLGKEEKAKAVFDFFQVEFEENKLGFYQGLRQSKAKL